MQEAERFNEFMVGRELKMVELKERIAALEDTIKKRTYKQKNI